jgi:hypothetical protein
MGRELGVEAQNLKIKKRTYKGLVFNFPKLLRLK